LNLQLFIPIPGEKTTKASAERKNASKDPKPLTKRRRRASETQGQQFDDMSCSLYFGLF
jgi:hypothetical protein